MIDEKRLMVAINSMNAQISKLPTEKQEALKNELKHNLTASELFAMQNMKSIAQASGKISLEVALWAYRIINNWVTSPVGDKIVLLEIMKVLAGK